MIDKNFAHDLFTWSVEALPEAAFVPFKHSSLSKLEMCLMRDVISDLFAFFVPTDGYLLRPAIEQVKHGPVFQFSSHIAVISKKQNI